MTAEGDWQAAVVGVATRYRWWVMHTRDSRSATARGWPDLTLIRPPRLLLIEVKTADGRLTGEQYDVLQQLAACGQEVMVARPSDLPLLVQILGPRNRPAELILPERRPADRGRRRRPRHGSDQVTVDTPGLL